MYMKYYFYKENDDILHCFPSDKNCTTEGYPYTNPHTKECLSECHKYINYNLCFPNCFSYDFLTKQCTTSYINKEIRDELINQIINDISEGILDTLIDSSIYEKKEELIIQEKDIVYQLTSSNIQNDYDNISYIDLGECEKKLKKQKNISDNSSILIFKIDYTIPGFYIPIVQYKFFHPDTKELLDLNTCIESPISLSYPILKDINNNAFMHDPNNQYYNDKCYPYTTDNGTDIILNDRKKEYNNKNLGLCEKNCKFIGINKENKKSNCKCEVKKTFKVFKNIAIDKDKLLNNFIDFKSTANIDIILCINTLFNLDGIKKNIGSYVIIIVIIITIINCIIFYAKENKALFFKIKSIIKEKTSDINNKKEKEKKKKKKKKNKFLKKKNEINLNKKYVHPKRKINKNLLNLNLSDNKINSNLKINITSNNSNSNLFKNIIVTNNHQSFNEGKEEENKMKYKSIKNYTDNEINSLVYKQAINIDRRTFFQYYISLIKTKHILIFSFYTNDYNSKLIKITLFEFSFTLFYTVNSLFFQDSTMHKIYEDYGAFNFIYQLPRILYSTIISSAITLIVKNLALIESDIIEIKNNINIINNSEKLNKKLKWLKIKMNLFFIITFIFLIIFWFYLSCFGAVYKNTQIHLLKDTLLSFGLSLIYPFVLNILPGLFRIPALKKDTKVHNGLYNFSKIIQII